MIDISPRITRRVPDKASAPRVSRDVSKDWGIPKNSPRRLRAIASFEAQIKRYSGINHESRLLAQSVLLHGSWKSYGHKLDSFDRPKVSASHNHTTEKGLLVQYSRPQQDVLYRCLIGDTRWLEDMKQILVACEDVAREPSVKRPSTSSSFKIVGFVKWQLLVQR